MSWWTLCFKEWRRRPLRTSVTMSGVAIALAALWSLLSFGRGYGQGVSGELDRLGAHILVVPKGCPYDAASIALHGASWPCYLPAKYLAQVQSVAGVATAAPVFMNAIARSDGTSDVYVGVDQSMLQLHRDWRIQGRFPQQPMEVLLGAEAARRNAWRVGQKIKLPGLENVRGRVSGILAPTQGADDTFIHLRLVDAQRTFRHPHELTHVLVKLSDPSDMERVAEALRGCDAGLSMNVVPLAHLFTTVQSLVNATRLWLVSIALVALLIAGTGVSNTVLMAVTERTREISTLRAIGARHGDIFRLFWLETLQICAVGGLIGVAGAWVGSHFLETMLRDRLPFAPAQVLLGWNWDIAGLCLLVALILGGFSGLFPAWRASHLAPAIGMRSRGESV
jgi:ABC-type lipoprotein release transport system permease subunit